MYLLSYIRGDFVYCPVLLVLFIHCGQGLFAYRKRSVSVITHKSVYFRCNPSWCGINEASRGVKEGASIKHTSESESPAFKASHGKRHPVHDCCGQLRLCNQQCPWKPPVHAQKRTKFRLQIRHFPLIGRISPKRLTFRPKLLMLYPVAVRPFVQHGQSWHPDLKQN